MGGRGANFDRTNDQPRPNKTHVCGCAATDRYVSERSGAGRGEEKSRWEDRDGGGEEYKWCMTPLFEFFFCFSPLPLVFLFPQHQQRRMITQQPTGRRHVSVKLASFSLCISIFGSSLRHRLLYVRFETCTGSGH